MSHRYYEDAGCYVEIARHFPLAIIFLPLALPFIDPLPKYILSYCMKNLCYSDPRSRSIHPSPSRCVQQQEPCLYPPPQSWSARRKDASTRAWDTLPRNGINYLICISIHALCIRNIILAIRLLCKWIDRYIETAWEDVTLYSGTSE